MNPNKHPTPVAILVAVIVLAALIWGVYYSRQNSSSVASIVSTTTTASNTTTNASSAAPVSATQAESIAVVEKAQSQAVMTSSVDVTGCTPKPATAGIKLGDKVRFTNSDTANHSISFDPAHVYVINGKGSMSITFDFWKFPGLRKYSCDTKQAAGTVYANAK